MVPVGISISYLSNLGQLNYEARSRNWRPA
jgi:hypothetical protein